MALWGIHVSKMEDAATQMLSQGIVVLGWPELRYNLLDCRTKIELEEYYSRFYPGVKKNRMLNHVRQLFAYVYTVSRGDIIVVPCSKSRQVAIAQVSGLYHYIPKSPYPHTRRVKWLKTNVPVETFGQDLRFSFRAFLSFFQVSRNEAESRVKTVIGSGKDPCWGKYS